MPLIVGRNGLQPAFLRSMAISKKPTLNQIILTIQ